MSTHLQRHLKVNEEQAPALKIAFASSDLPVDSGPNMAILYMQLAFFVAFIRQK